MASTPQDSSTELPVPFAGTASATLPIEGMSCVGCASRVEKALSALDGVTEASVNFASERADIAFDANSLSIVEIAAAVTEIGFSVPHQTIELSIQGMTCTSCAGHVERALVGIPGVLSALVNLGNEHALVNTIPDMVDIVDLVHAVSQAGYRTRVMKEAEATSTEEEALARRSRKDLRTFAVAAAMTVPLVLQMMWELTGGVWVIPAIIQLALATPVQFWAGARFYRAAFGAIRVGTGNMDLLVALGTSAAYGLSLFNTFLPESGGSDLYFEASTAIITLVLLGKLLESRAKHSTTAAIRALMKLRPVAARLLRNGSEIEVPVAEVGTGDLVVVRPGERVPVDGIIEDGKTQMDESLLTGESMPVAKRAGNPVTGGAINGDGLVRVRATTIGAEAVLAHIIKLVQGAQASKAPVQKLVDRIAAVFVPVVVIVAAVTFLGWWFSGAGAPTAIINAVAVLVIACPCALGLATPTAIMVGTGVAARYGVLIKDAEALECAHRITTIVLDKTGTLTEGQPTVTAVVPATCNETRLVCLAGSAQQGSEHPLARAVLRHAEEKGIPLLPVSDFTRQPGLGLKATVDGQSLAIGNRRFVVEEGIVTSSLEGRARTLENAGKTVMWVVMQMPEPQLLGIIAVNDRVRAGATAAVSALHDNRIETVMMTGDNQRTAAAVAEEVGIEQVLAEVLPDHKAAAIKRLAADGKTVAMVGDGINDAPALAAADIGFAMGTGTDVAMHAAGITLMRGEPRLIADAIDVSRVTYRKIKQNLFWAFIYNLVAIPLAASGYLSPVIAGATMALSSISVVSNSLLLKNWQPGGTQ